MSYIKRLNNAFLNAPVLPLTPNTRYVFFSDCHRGIGNVNDNFLKNENSFFAALQYYYQNDFSYIEVGDGDELWENSKLSEIIEIHSDIFTLLSRFHKSGRLYMLYGNHDIVKRKLTPIFDNLKFHEGIILKSDNLPVNLRVTHGHQADTLNSVFWRLARFLVRYLWAPLENLGVVAPSGTTKHSANKAKIEKKLIEYAKNEGCLLLVGHTHRPALGNELTPYFNCGSSVHPRNITCIELNGYNISLVKWYTSTELSGHSRNVYSQYPPTFPVYIKREVIASENLLVFN